MNKAKYDHEKHAMKRNDSERFDNSLSTSFGGEQQNLLPFERYTRISFSLFKKVKLSFLLLRRCLASKLDSNMPISSDFVHALIPGRQIVIQWVSRKSESPLLSPHHLCTLLAHQHWVEPVCYWNYVQN